MQATLNPAHGSTHETQTDLINQASFDLEPQDLLAFINYHYVSSRAVRQQRWWLAIVGFCILASLPIMIILGSNGPSGKVARDIWPTFLAPLLFLTGFPMFYRWGLKRTCRRLLTIGDQRGYFGPRSLSLADYGLHEKTVHGDTVRPWPSVRKIVLTKQHALIYTSDTEAFVVPKAAFKDAAAFDSFIQQAAHRARVNPTTV